MQKVNTNQLVKVFDPKQNESKLNVFGQQFEQVLGEGGSNKSGTTKVFATEKLSKQEIIDYAQSLAGTMPLEEIKPQKAWFTLQKKMEWLSILEIFPKVRIAQRLDGRLKL